MKGFFREAAVGALVVLLAAVCAQGNELAVSPWSEHQAEMYRQGAPADRYDVMIVPFQTQGEAFDRIGRSLMARVLGERLSREKGLRVVPVTLAARCLGEGRRSVGWEAIAALADRLGVDAVIVGRVGHDRDETMSGTLTLHRRRGGEPVPVEGAELLSWDHLPFNDEFLPYRSFDVLLDAGMAAMPWADSEAPNPGDGVGEAPLLPETPAGVIERRQGTPTSAAWRLEMLGVLAPDDSLEREDFFERALIIARGLPPVNPYRARLRSRALLYLNRRPAAVAALGASGTPEDTPFRAFLDGDLPSLETACSDLPSPPTVESFLQQVELDDIHLRWGRDLVSPDRVDAVLDWLPVGWRDLGKVRFQRENSWRFGSNLFVKRWMDEAFPVDGFTAEGLAGERVALGQSPLAGGDVDLAFLDHYERVLQTVEDEAFRGFGPDRLDLLELYRSLGVENLTAVAGFLVEVQGMYEKGLHLIDGFEVRLPGIPKLHMYRAKALFSKSWDLSPKLKEAWMGRGWNAAREVLAWEQGQTRCATWARGILAKSKEYKEGIRRFDHDYPSRPYYWTGTGADRVVLRVGLLGKENRDSLAAVQDEVKNRALYRGLHLLYTQASFGTFSSYVKKCTSRDPGFLERNVHRFAGHPLKPGLLAEQKPARAEVIFRKAIKVSPRAWEPYRALAAAYLRKGSFEDASELLKSYPAFSEEPRVSTTLSSKGRSAGDLFWRLGLADRAEPFWRFGIDCESHMATEILSRAQLDMRHHRFAEALEPLRTVIQRYKMAWPYRSYIPLMNLFGYKDRSWKVLEAVLPKRGQAEPWDAGFKNLRVDGKTEEDTLAWLGRDDVRKLSGETFSRRVLEFVLVDRHPDRETLRRFRALVPEEGAEQRFLRGCVDLEAGRYLEAFKGFMHFGDKRRLYRRALPYLAWAKGKYKGEYRLTFSSPSVKNDAFYHWLVRGVLDGLQGRTAASVKDLHEAWWHLVERAWDFPFSKNYQLVQMTHWLAVETGEKPFRDLALELARGYARVRPLSSWMHAIVGRYTTDDRERVEAIAMAVHLDPRSAWLNDYVTEEGRKQADEWWDRHNPFREVEGKEPDPI